jgi:hypothetical protein
VKALLIPVDGPPREVALPGGGGSRFMRSLRDLIGADCAERIWITSRWEAWLDENGASAGKPDNQAATLLARSFGWQCSIRGTVIITGLDKDTEPTALSPGQADAIIRKIRTPARQRSRAPTGHRDRAGQDCGPRQVRRPGWSPAEAGAATGAMGRPPHQLRSRTVQPP